MARTFGKIFASQWDDEDFISLGAGAKYVYDFLISQHDLGHSGIIALRIAPWARRLSKTAAEVEAALRELHDRRYVVIDDDEMLLLVRSLIRRDDVYKQPNVFKAAAAQIYACPSKPIRHALLAELERLDEQDMKGDTREVCGELVAWLRKGSGNPSPEPSGKATREGSADESRQSGQGGQGVGKSAGGEGSGNPSGKPLPRARAHARVPLPLPLPLAPSPNPNPTPPGEPGTLFDAGADEQRNDRADKPRRNGSRKRTSGPKPRTPADELTDAFWERHGHGQTQSWVAIRGVLRTALGNGVERDELARALDLLAREGTAISGGTLQTARKRIAAASEGRVVVPFQRSANQTISGQRVSATARAIAEVDAAGEEASRIIAAMREGRPA